MALGLGYAFTLGPLFDLLMAWPVPVKVCVALALIAPLAFCMGMPFPLALATTSAHARALVPWAWGVNGCASVLGAMLAMLCAIHFGFTVVIVIALLLYGLAALGFPQPRQAPGRLRNLNKTFSPQKRRDAKIFPVDYPALFFGSA